MLQLHKGLTEDIIKMTKRTREQILKNGYLVNRNGMTLYYDNIVYKKDEIIHLIGFDLKVERVYFNKELNKYAFVCSYQSQNI